MFIIDINVEKLAKQAQGLSGIQFFSSSVFFCDMLCLYL